MGSYQSTIPRGRNSLRYKHRRSNPSLEELPPEPHRILSNVQVPTNSLDSIDLQEWGSDDSIGSPSERTLNGSMEEIGDDIMFVNSVDNLEGRYNPSSDTSINYEEIMGVDSSASVHNVDSYELFRRIGFHNEQNLNLSESDLIEVDKENEKYKELKEFLRVLHEWRPAKVTYCQDGRPDADCVREHNLDAGPFQITPPDGEDRWPSEAVKEEFFHCLPKTEKEHYYEPVTRWNTKLRNRDINSVNYINYHPENPTLYETLTYYTDPTVPYNGPEEGWTFTVPHEEYNYIAGLNDINRNDEIWVKDVSIVPFFRFSTSYEIENHLRWKLYECTKKQNPVMTLLKNTIFRYIPFVRNGFKVKIVANEIVPSWGGREFEGMPDHSTLLTFVRETKFFATKNDVVKVFHTYRKHYIGRVERTKHGFLLRDHFHNDVYRLIKNPTKCRMPNWWERNRREMRLYKSDSKELLGRFVYVRRGTVNLWFGPICQRPKFGIMFEDGIATNVKALTLAAMFFHMHTLTDISFCFCNLKPEPYFDANLTHLFQVSPKNSTLSLDLLKSAESFDQLLQEVELNDNNLI